MTGTPERFGSSREKDDEMSEAKANSQIWQRYMNRVRERAQILIGDRRAKGSLHRAALYERISIEEQQEGYSIQEQSIADRQFAENKGWIIAGEYVDEGYSGTNDRRPAFRRLLADAQRKQFDVVIVHKIDRFYRNAQGLLKTHSDLSHQGILFVSIKENIDFTKSWGKVILAVLGVLAEIFVDNLRDETRKGKKGRARNGLHNGSIPFGYCTGQCSACTDPNGQGYCPEHGQPDRYRGPSLVLHPVESVAVRLAFEWYATDECSDGDIADRLDAHVHHLPDGSAHHFRTKGRNYRNEEKKKSPHYRPPGPFTRDTVRDLLKRPFYAGVVPYYGSEFDGEKVIRRSQPEELFEAARHPPIISPTLFERCALLRETRGRRPKGGKVRRPSRIYLLSGHLDCARSGGSMHCQTVGRRKAHRYVCSDRIQHRRPCDQPSVDAEALESQILQHLLDFCIPFDWHDDILACMIDEGGEESLRWQRKQLQEGFDEVETRYQAEQLSRAAYTRARQAYYRRMRELIPAEHPQVDVTRARRLLADFSAIWALATPVEQKQMLRLMLKEARVDGTQIIGIRWYHPFDQMLRPSPEAETRPSESLQAEGQAT